MAAKNIVLLSDGTGNSSGKLFKTNVWRLYEALDLSDPGKQIAYYDDGVGTSSFKLFAVLGGIFGFGLKRNVIDIYSFCCRNYAKGDRIYGFGFSRGAFTIRVVAGLIARQGLVPYDGDEDALERYAASAYRDYRRRFNSTKGLVDPLRRARDKVVNIYRKIIGVAAYKTELQIDVDTIHFLGLWDTVDAYGGPIEEITRAIDRWYWPLSMPDRFMHTKVHRACHALALEDERDAFRPVLWDERYVRGNDMKLHAINAGWTPKVDVEWAERLTPIDTQRLSQVWFAGVHADIGGGYPQDGIAHVTLDWMIDRAERYGLKLNGLRRADLRSHINPYDKLNDSRKGLAGYYRYKPRNIEEINNYQPYKSSMARDIEYMRSVLSGKDLKQADVKAGLAAGTDFVAHPDPTIHISVLERIEATRKPDPEPPYDIATDGYVPIVLPPRYSVTDHAGNITADDSPASRGIPAAAGRDMVWNLVWWRRVVYFLTVLTSVALFAVPLLDEPDLGSQTPLVLLRPLIGLVEAFLPSFLAPWFTAYRNAPGLLAIGVIVIAALLLTGGKLQGNIRDVMRAAWLQRAAAAGWADKIASVRNRSSYRIVFYGIKQWILPTLFAALILYGGVAIVVQIGLRSADALGAFCAGGASASGPWKFETNALCSPTGFHLRRGEEYRITFSVMPAWTDDGIPASPAGMRRADTPWYMIFGLPFRRLLSEGWFVPVVRIGRGGGAEYPLLMKPNPPEQAIRYQVIIKPHVDGQAFLFVNDVWFKYGNNHGAADVTFERLDPFR